jgi:glycosyltransferase involved in cell wall biosynthesis
MSTINFTVSVIIPAYNAAPFIERAVASVQALDEVLEIIVINDCSTDGTKQLVASMAASDSRIKILETGGSHPQGAGVARNMGLLKAQAPFIAFLDADDYYLLNRFQRTSNLFSKERDIEAVLEAVEVEGNSKSNPFSLAPKGQSSLDLALDLLRFNNCAPHLNGLTVKRNVGDTLNFDESLFYTQDTMFFTQLFLSHKVLGANDPTPVAGYCLHGNNSVFKQEERRRFDPILGKKLLQQVEADQPYSVRFYLFKRFLVRQCSKRSKWRFFRFLCYVKHAATIFIRYPILFPATFLRSYILDKGQP